MGIALLVDSEARMRPSHSSRGVDPFLLVENPRRGIERYLGLGFIFGGIWQFRQSKSDSDDGSDAD
jgi:hypothetical protein